MKILGIIAEYDPFHNGHLFHLTDAKKQILPDLTYIVLSPCFKQRGSLSLLSPSDRARCALEAGADAVFYLPVLWAVRDAEHYAAGAVSMLARLGVSHLAFGAETADLALLRHAASFLESPDQRFLYVLKEKLDSGSGYPSAFSAALSQSLPDAEGLLDKPNNVLAVCYLRAIQKLGLSIEPVVISRAGSYHSCVIDPDAPSASALRESLSRGSYASAFRALPSFTADILRRRFLDGRIPDMHVLDTLLISRLRAMSRADCSCLPDLSEGIENALYTVAGSVNSRTELISFLTGKRYSAARISRLCACVLTGISREQIESASLPDSALLLGLRKKADMTALWKDLPITVISSFSEWKKAASPADLQAWSVWAQCCRIPDTLPFTEKIVTL